MNYDKQQAILAVCHSTLLSGCPSHLVVILVQITARYCATDSTRAEEGRLARVAQRAARTGAPGMTHGAMASVIRPMGERGVEGRAEGCEGSRLGLGHSRLRPRPRRGRKCAARPVEDSIFAHRESRHRSSAPRGPHLRSGTSPRTRCTIRQNSVGGTNWPALNCIREETERCSHAPRAVSSP